MNEGGSRKTSVPPVLSSSIPKTGPETRRTELQKHQALDADKPDEGVNALTRLYGARVKMRLWLCVSNAGLNHT